VLIHFTLFAHVTFNIIIVIQDRPGTRTRRRKYYYRSSKTNKHHHAGAWRRCVFLFIICYSNSIHIIRVRAKKERKKERKFEIKHRVWYTLVIIEQHIEKKKRILTCVISAILSAAQMTKKVCSICEANMFIELVV
jgi:hypothetical protein